MASNGGSWELGPDPASGGIAARGQVFNQVVTELARGNSWTTNVEPNTMIGDSNWTSVNTTVAVFLGPAGPGITANRSYAGICHRVLGGGGQMAGRAGDALCLTLHSDRRWTVGAGPWAGPVKSPPLATGLLPSATSMWHELSLSSTLAGVVSAAIDARVVEPGTHCGTGIGRVALVSGWNQASFDNLTIQSS